METKKLELLLLAGCSCLLALLSQPIASALTPPSNSTVALPIVRLEGASCKANFQKRLLAER